MVIPFKFISSPLVYASGASGKTQLLFSVMPSPGNGRIIRNMGLESCSQIPEETGRPTWCTIVFH